MFSLTSLFHKDKPIQLYDLTEGAYKYYITKTHGNRSLSKNEVSRKITRNILSGEYITQDDRFITYAYGNLLIGVSKKNNKVTWLQNNWWNKDVAFVIDEKKRKKLNAQLGINDDKIINAVNKSNKKHEKMFKMLADS